MSAPRRGARRAVKFLMLVAGASLPAALPAPLPAQAVPLAPAPASAPLTRADSVQAVVRRAQRLVNDGAGAEGRALLDSLLDAVDPGSADEAEALFWRAALASSWEDAQRDFLRVMLEHDRSARAGDAMLRLAQGEIARGDRDAAVRYLERLAREAPESPARAEAGLWHGRILNERGDRANGCRVLREHRGLVRAGAVELENQYEFLLRGCPDAVSAAPRDSAPSEAPREAPREVPRDTARAMPRDTAPRPAVRPAPRPAPPASAVPRGPSWSVQAAALRTRAEADALAARLRERGYDARVDGAEAPFRVRFGYFPTRAAAAAALERYKTRERADGFLVEVPRG